ncbi:MAG: ABC transporter permease [Cyclobacteriaceae bacterium]
MSNSNTKDWDIVLEPNSRILRLGIKEVWVYRDLLMLFVKRDIVAFYKQTILGPIWFLVQPLFTVAIYVFVFGQLAGLSTSNLPQPIFYLTGITFWTYFSQTLTKTSTILKSNISILGKVYFPRIIMPLSLVLSNMFKLLVQFGLLMLVCIYYVTIQEFEWSPSIYLIAFPVLIALLALQALGFGMIVSALTTKYRDLALLLSFGIQLLMYISAIVYPLDAVTGLIGKIVGYNPISYLFEGFRMSLFSVGQFDWTTLAYSTVFTLIVLLGGLVIFNKVEKDFVDTV